MNKRELVVQINGKNYTIKYPNVGQLIDISIQESTLSGGRMKDLILQGTIEHQDAYVTIKTIAFFDVMLPNLTKDLKVESLQQLDPVDFIEVNKAYWEHIEKWLDEWKKNFSNPITEVPEEQMS